MRSQYRFDEHLKDHVLEQVLDTPKFKAFYLKHPDWGRMESCLIIFSPEGINILGDLCPGNDVRNSGVHAYGYGLDWFAGNLSWSYLCEKFLSKEWHSELAAEECRQRAAEIMAGGTDYFDHDRELEEILGNRETLARMLRDCRDDLRSPVTDEQDRPFILSSLHEHRRMAAKTRESLVARRRDHAQDYLDLADALEGGEMGVETFGTEMSRIDADFYEACPGYGYLPRSRGLLVAIQKKFSELYHKMKQTSPVGAA